ncbi:MAG: hypothetical protein V4582_24395 [Pseudomonadota bacterium]
MAEINNTEARSEAGTPGSATHEDAASNTLQSAAHVGGTAVHVTRGVIKEAIVATEDVGSGLVGGVSHLAQDIVHGVRDVGGSAVHSLTDLLVDVVGGVRQVAGAALGHGQANGAARQLMSGSEQIEQDSSPKGPASARHDAGRAART